jgi:hypothetical protein
MKFYRLFTLYVPTGIAFSVVNRNHISTVGAFVLLPLNPQKLLHALFFQFLEIFHHAHVITLSVTPVHAIQILAWHSFALETKSNLIFREFLAASFDETVFVAGKAPCAMGYFASLLRYPSRIG